VVLTTVRGSGHEVPIYQPESALVMISPFLQGLLPPTIDEQNQINYSLVNNTSPNRMMESKLLYIDANETIKDASLKRNTNEPKRLHLFQENELCKY
jgi:hypothetical protein